jgi:hypothetical protein
MLDAIRWIGLHHGIAHSMIVYLLPMAHGQPADHREADDVSSQEQAFTPETDKLIRDIATMSDRWSINPFMFGEPSAEVDRRQKPKLRDALVALRDRLRRRPKPSRGE